MDSKHVAAPDWYERCHPVDLLADLEQALRVLGGHDLHRFFADVLQLGDVLEP